MTQVDILEMAERAGIENVSNYLYQGFLESLVAFAELIAAKECNACANIAWNMEPDDNGPIETAIRARIKK